MRDAVVDREHAATCGSSTAAGAGRAAESPRSRPTSAGPASPGAAAPRPRACGAPRPRSVARPQPSTATTLMIEVPTRMRSPSCSRARPAIFSPLTNVPFVEPMSWMKTSASVELIFACRRDTMSSTSTMSRSLDRPMMISRFIRSGNSPPWYLPEMKRSAKRGRSFMDLQRKDSKILVPNALRAQANHLDQSLWHGLFSPLQSSRRRASSSWRMRPQRIDDAPVDLFGHHQAGMAQRHGHRVRARTSGWSGAGPPSRAPRRSS